MINNYVTEILVDIARICIITTGVRADVEDKGTHLPVLVHKLINGDVNHLTRADKLSYLRILALYVNRLVQRHDVLCSISRCLRDHIEYTLHNAKSSIDIVHHIRRLTNRCNEFIIAEHDLYTFLDDLKRNFNFLISTERRFFSGCLTNDAKGLALIYDDTRYRECTNIACEVSSRLLRDRRCRIMFCLTKVKYRDKFINFICLLNVDYELAMPLPEPVIIPFDKYRDL